MEETGGKVISILEGGYSLSSTQKKAAAEQTHEENRRSRSKTAAAKKSVTETTTTDVGKVKIEKACDDLHKNNAPEESYGILPGDGGLVKGVMAHVMALTGKKC